jgi:hypothetical protein
MPIQEMNYIYANTIGFGEGEALNIFPIRKDIAY